MGEKVVCLPFFCSIWTHLYFQFCFPNSVIATDNIYMNRFPYLMQINTPYHPTLNITIIMDSNPASNFFLNHSAPHSVYYQAKEDDGIIDLGLSLRTLQPEPYHPSGHFISQEGYDELMSWPQGNNQSLKQSNSGYQGNAQQECEDDTEGVQSKESWVYVKVNMDGVAVGRKICILDHGGYSSLAVQLEDMFGRQTETGLRLFQPGSEFCLFYKDREENWRTVGDVPWKEFIEGVKRLRIAQRK